MDQNDTTAPAPGGWGRRIRSGVVAGGLATGLALAGLGVAVAQEAPSTDTTTPQAPADAPAGLGPAGPRGRGGHGGPGGHHGFGHGAIHGEFTTAAPNGGYQTLATQSGEVTKVSKSSITVKSEDGFERTYSVDENTLVNAGRDGIDNVADGESVRITAVVEGGKARAVQVDDSTDISRLNDQWRPRRPALPAPSASGSGTNA